MDYVVVGLNHKTTPLELRERLNFPPEAIDGALGHLLSMEGVEEGLILSTCNRVEVYAASSTPSIGMAAIGDFLSQERHVPREQLEPHLYKHHAVTAVTHGFRVAASLDSMIVGEAQILGQVRDAYEKSLQTNSCGVYLNQFMSRALNLAKRIRTETEIATRPVSIGSASVELTKKIFGHLENKRVVLIGAGEMGELVLTCLKGEGVKDITLVNRTLSKAQELAKEHGGARTASLDDLQSLLLKADVVISSVNATEPLIKREVMESLMEQRKNNPAFFIDLGVPRNIDPRVNEIGNIYLYNIDDLQRVVQSNMDQRLTEAKKAEVLIEKEAVTFYDSVIHRKPTIAALGRKFHRIRQQELEKTLSRLSSLSEEEKKSLEKCTESIVNKILHDPILLLQSEEIKDRDHEAHHFIRKLFRLED